MDLWMELPLETGMERAEKNISDNSHERDVEIRTIDVVAWTLPFGGLALF